MSVLVALAAAALTTAVGGAALARWSRAPRARRSPRGHPARAREVGPVDWAEWCDHVARRSRAGASLRHALVGAGRDVPGQGVDDVEPRLARGHPLAEILGDAPPDSDHALAAATVRTIASLNGPAAPAFERTAAILRGRAAERAERLTASAQARLSALVLTVVPIAMLGLLAGSDDAVRATLTTAPGLLCLGLGLTTNVIGWRWMQRTIRSAQ